MGGWSLAPHSLLSHFRFSFFIFGLGKFSKAFDIKLEGEFSYSRGFKKKKNIFLKKEKSDDFKLVESSLKTAGQRMQPWPLKMHACKRANSEVLDIQAPTMLSAGTEMEEEKKEKDIVK